MFSEEHPEESLYLQTGGDVDVEVVSAGSPPQCALRTGNGQVLSSPDGNIVEDYYMLFQIDDDFIFRGLPTSRVQIEIEYLDRGTGMFSIQYDARGSGQSAFKDTGLVVKTNTGEFKTAIFP